MQKGRGKRSYTDRTGFPSLIPQPTLRVRRADPARSDRGTRPLAWTERSFAAWDTSSPIISNAWC